MERTARLVRLALAGLPDPRVRGAADIAAAVARSGGSSVHEGAHAAGGARELAHAVLRAGGGSGHEGSHDAGGPGGGSGRELARAVLRAGGGLVHEGAHNAGGPGGGSGRELTLAVLRAGRGSGLEGTHAVVRKEKGGGRASQFGGEDYSGQGEREAKPGGQAEAVGSKAKNVAAGPGRGLPLVVSLLTQGADPHATSPTSGCSSSSASAKACPLSIHDKAFLSCKKMGDSYLGAISEDEAWSTDIDVSEKITTFLTKSSGTVQSFRIDSSKWTNARCLDEWLDLLSEKSVQELEVLNLGHRVSTVFPIQSLQSKDLRVFRIGFLALDLDLFCFNYNSLQILDFFCCSLESIKLSWVVTHCISLRELRIQYCCVDLHINSNSLKFLYSVGNTGNRIIIASAPNLVSLVAGMVPKQLSSLARQRIRASISLSRVPTLNLIKHLNLLHHKITINNKDITKDIGLLPSVEGLSMSLEMSNITQLQSFRKLLESFPMLQHLSVARMDKVGSDEGLDITIDKPFDDINMVDCVKNSLTAFFLEDFHGGPSEKHLIECLLKNAPNLVQLSTSGCKSASKRSIRVAVKEIKNYDRASEGCRFTFE